jgi:hypothetical protein
MFVDQLTLLLYVLVQLVTRRDAPAQLQIERGCMEGGSIARYLQCMT